jgi:hypothetical protein
VFLVPQLRLQFTYGQLDKADEKRFTTCATGRLLAPSIADNPSDLSGAKRALTWARTLQ